MPLIVLLVVLVVLCGGVGFGGFFALGSLTWLVQVLFAVLLICLLWAAIRHVSYGGPYDPLL